MTSAKHLFNQRFKQPKEKSNTKSEISKLTKIPVSILNQVYDRGLKAYEKEGSYMKKRVAAQQYAFGRVYSFAYQATSSAEIKHDLDLYKKWKKSLQK